MTRNQWAWVSGKNTLAAYGVYTSNAVNNNPGSRDFPAMVLGLAPNLLYVWGGNGYAQSSTGNSIIGPHSQPE